MTPTRLSALLLLASLSVPTPSAAFEPSGLLEIHYINPTVQAGASLGFVASQAPVVPERKPRRHGCCAARTFLVSLVPQALDNRGT